MALFDAATYLDQYNPFCSPDEYRQLVEGMGEDTPANLLTRRMNTIYEKEGLFGWFRENQLKAFAAIKCRTLLLNTPAMVVLELTLDMSEPENLPIGLARAFRHYATDENCEVFRVSVPLHAQLVREELERQGAHNAMVQVDCNLRKMI